MSDLQVARVEAAARALFHDPLASDDYTWEEMVAEDNSRAELWRDDARRVLAAADAVVTVEMIAVPRPRVPFGPNGVPEDEATAHYLREVVKKIDCGYATVGGSNVTATVRKLLLDAADALLRGGEER